MTEEILNAMDERRKNKNNTAEYERLNKEIRNKCNEAKENWLNEKCEEMEKVHQQNSQDMHKKIKEICHTRGSPTSGCIKSKDGDIIMDKDKILERWTEYIGDLYNDMRNEERTDTTNNEGPPILEEEVISALKKMKNGKAAGPDNITKEMIDALEEFGISTVTKLLNNIYNSGSIPADMTKSIFIALPKTANANECESHRTISLMSHITKLLLRIIMMRVRNKILPEIAEEQCGFIEGKGTINAIYIQKLSTEYSMIIS